MGISKAIQGQNVHVYAKVSDVYYEIVCGTDVTYEKTQELIGATTPDSGQWREVRPRLKQWRMNIMGAATTENDGDISAFYLNQDAVFSAAQEMKITFTGNDNTMIVITGFAYIERDSFNGPADGSSEYEINLVGNGSPTETTISDPVVAGENIASDTFVISGGAVTDASLIGVTIIGAWVEGSNLESMGVSYTHNSGTGTVTPDPLVTIDGQRLFVIWQYS